MLISKWHCKSTNDTCKNIEKLCCTIEFMIFMNKKEEALIHRLSDHLSSWHELRIEFMENVLQIISFNRFFRVKELEELLDELRCDIYFQ